PGPRPRADHRPARRAEGRARRSVRPLGADPRRRGLSGFGADRADEGAGRLAMRASPQPSPAGGAQVTEVICLTGLRGLPFCLLLFAFAFRIRAFSMGYGRGAAEIFSWEFRPTAMRQVAPGRPGRQ